MRSRRQQQQERNQALGALSVVTLRRHASQAPARTSNPTPATASITSRSPQQVERGAAQPVKVLQHLPQRLLAGWQAGVRAVGQ